MGESFDKEAPVVELDTGMPERVHMLVTYMVDAFYPAVGLAVTEILAAHGISVEFSCELFFYPIYRHFNINKSNQSN